LQEIELALRGLIEACVSEVELADCIERTLRKRYEETKRPAPSRLAELTFEDYRTIVSAKDNWRFFEGVLGRSRELVASKLELVRKVRNDVFHFREVVAVLDHQILATTRNWLLDKALLLRERRGKGAAP